MPNLEITHSTQSLDNIVPNSYNPNKMNERQFSAELESIQHFGFIDPITVRETGDGLVIVDGEHRWRGAKEIIRRIKAGEVTLVTDAVYDESRGWVHPEGRRLTDREASPAFQPVYENQAVPVANLGSISEVDAKRLTIILNETRGTSNAVDLAEVLAQIQEELGGSLEDLQLAMPYGANELDQLLSITGSDFGDLGDVSSGGTDFLEDFVPPEQSQTAPVETVDEETTEAPTPDEDIKGSSQRDEVTEALGEAYFQLSYPVTEEQRAIIIRALGLVKSQEFIANSVEALVWLSCYYLKEAHGEEPAYDFEVRD